MSEPHSSAEENEHERWRTLHELEDWLETPMQILSLVWLGLVLAEMIWSTTDFFAVLGLVIWGIFIAEFALRFFLAPAKLRFLKRNPITVIALVAPAFRFLTLLRALRFLRFARTLRLVRLVGTVNRGLNALGKSFGRRGLGYVVAATVLVTTLGAAGMLSLEPADEVQGGFTDFGHALWWTAMVIATMGSDFWPRTGEGRLLCLLLALYGFTVFGYLAASLAAFFIEQESKAPDSNVPGASELASLRQEIAALRADLNRHADRN
ncbi:MAG: Potassium voltage-gated channel subfamily [Alphaproteobacteria bacterium]|jgi:voltage-gated potassium channel|nr:Potassium voltage-gated channel subfamily [Alphaproteobacteria bacterium]